MIQRIQSFYLLVIAVLMGITVATPVANFVVEKGNLLYTLDMNGLSLVKPTGNVPESGTLLLPIVGITIVIFALFALFSYKNRRKQIRICVVNMFFMILYYVVLLVYVWTTCSRLNADWHLYYTAIFPLICLILNFITIGAIGKDEKLVKSADRLR